MECGSKCSSAANRLSSSAVLRPAVSYAMVRSISCPIGPATVSLTTAGRDARKLSLRLQSQGLADAEQGDQDPVRQVVQFVAHFVNCLVEEKGVEQDAQLVALARSQIALPRDVQVFLQKRPRRPYLP